MAELVGHATGVQAARRWEALRESLLPHQREPGCAITLLRMSEQAADAIGAAPLVLETDEGTAMEEGIDLLAAQVRLHRGTDRLRVYQVDRDRTDQLNSSIAELESLALSLKPDHPVRPHTFTNLSVALKVRWRTGSARFDDLDRAVELSAASVAETDPADALWASRVNNHGSALRDRYQETGTVADLEEAVAAVELLAARPEAPAVERVVYASNAGQGLRELYDITADTGLLRRAMKVHRMALRLSEDEPAADLPRALDALGKTQRELHRSAKGIERAVAWQQRGVELLTGHEVEWGGRVGSLGLTWLELARVRRRRDGDGADEALARALECLDRALDGTGEVPRPAVGHLRGWAEAHELRWQLHGDESDLRAALAGYDKALEMAASDNALTPLETARAGGTLAWRAVPDGGHEEALRFFTRGLAGLDDLLRRQMMRRDQRNWQRHADPLVSCAAVAFARTGRPHEAADVLDSYRSRESAMVATLARIAPGTPSPDPAADRQLDDIRQVFHTWLREDGGPSGDDSVERRIAAELGPLAAADFRALTTSTSAADRAAETGHYLAYLVSSDLGGAIVLVRPDRTAVTRLLPRLTEAAVRRRLSALRRAYRARAADPAGFERALRTLGAWAGPALVRPLLRMVPDAAPLALVPCGPLAELPLLTASLPGVKGVKGVKGVNGASDRVYPLLGRPLLFSADARTLRAHPPVPRGAGTVTAVDGEHGLNARSARAEAQALGLHTAPRRIDGPSSTPAEVMAAVLDDIIVHFSCHGRADWNDPSRSAVLLGGTAALTLADITRSRFRNSPLIVLASCDIAAPDRVVPDQTFGIPAAFLHSGAGTVIAPAYAVSRPAAILLTVRLYAELAEGHPPHQSLTRTQRWIATTPTDDKVAFVRELIARLSASGAESDALEWLATVLPEVLRRSGGDELLSHWCLFTAHA
ncbi:MULTISPECIES: CHAT domain-containing protein [unclassified Streptomyces]|uniref:CHAT domain-containing protein n=1 Tax=unclassified Streptomyces TaxID=2593676 RepID=UPI00380E2364